MDCPRYANQGCFKADFREGSANDSAFKTGFHKGCSMFPLQTIYPPVCETVGDLGTICRGLP